MTKSITKHFRIFGCFIILSSAAVASSVNIAVVPSIGPSYYSTSYSDYVSNAQYALQNGGLTSYHESTDPMGAHYSVAGSPIDLTNVIETAFPSWLGAAPPAADYTDEYGNDLYFGLALTSDTAFHLSDVTFSSTFLGGSVFTNAKIPHFSASTIGVAANGAIYNSSAFDGLPIVALYSVGFSEFFYVTNADDLAGYQQSIHEASMADPTGVATGAYYLSGASGQVSLDSAVPEPATLALVGLALAAIGIAGKRRANRQRSE